MIEIQLVDKKFQLFIPNARILDKIDELTQQINRAYSGQQLEILVLLDGAKMFADTILPRLEFNYNAHYQQVKSYQGMHSGGAIQFDREFLNQFKGKNLLILEDIVDTGNTLKQLSTVLMAQNLEQLAIATLLYKPRQMKHSIPLNFIGFEIGPEFVVGFGMDYYECGRELKDIYHLKSQ
ncbi:MAG: phosphoribosyltransferase family protein [Saprospiraceae bacterium]